MITNKKTHRLNIIIYAVLILLTVAIPTSYAATDKARIIPLPKDISLPTLEGATSAPQEINHKRIYLWTGCRVNGAVLLWQSRL